MGIHPVAQRRRCVLGREADVELRHRAWTGMTLVAALPTSKLVTASVEGSKCVVALVELRMRDAVDEAGELGHRIVGLVRIGGMALASLDHDGEAQRAAPADLDRVAQPVDAAWLAHQAVVRHMAVVAHPLQHLDRAVDGRTFLVAGDEEGDGTLELAGRSDEVDGRGREGGDGTLHVRGAAPVDEAIGDVGGKGRMRPGIHVALGHDVGMPREAQMRRARAEAGKEVLHIRRVRILEDQALADEASLRQADFPAMSGRRLRWGLRTCSG